MLKKSLLCTLYVGKVFGKKAAWRNQTSVLVSEGFSKCDMLLQLMKIFNSVFKL